ncbi:hypothetical protein MYU51_005281 [Penicillium brevicompactum]|uniref:uncharacterized protein n=1 Tax=Penicillium brevicompactum TaxID=5074 RepID=UPI00253FD7BB|nr:uncharacterized protein N7506_006792 [Penicillium brevicompactum]KAJ5333009.1 hypothetical protein N7506_006792 [Penicillium brevicompactum]
MSFNDVPVFEPDLFEEDDNAKELACKNIIKKLITQQITPFQAAEAVDEWVVRDSTTKYDKFRQRDPPFTLNPGENAFDDGPNTCGLVDMVIRIVAHICSAYPPGHIVQDSLIEFFQALKAMPRHDAPDVTYKHDLTEDCGSDECGSDKCGTDELTFEGKVTLWAFGTKSFAWRIWDFFREAEDIAYPFSDVEVFGSEKQLRWRNLQSFISRLTALELLDCSSACALPYLLPNHVSYPNLEVHKMGGPRRITGDLIAAAHWLETDKIRKFVFRQCKNNVSSDGCRTYWNMNTWNQLKSQMSFISSSDRFEQQIRVLAQSLREKMESEE